MKTTTLFIILLTITAKSYSQAIQFNPYIGRSREDIIIQGYVNARNNEIKREQFDRFMKNAELEFNRGNYSGFITATNYALQTGYSFPELYYYRGIAYENLRDFKQSKSNYKLAKKKGVYEANNALKNLKRKK
jgi:hypothetical protein